MLCNPVTTCFFERKSGNAKTRRRKESELRLFAPSRLCVGIILIGAVVLVCGATLAAQTTRPASPPTPIGWIPQSQPDPDALARRQADLKVVERMVEHVKDAATIDPAARAAILKMWQDRRPDDDPRSMMTAAVALMSPPYKAAMDALDVGKHAEAVAALKPLLDSKDFYISTHAAALTARNPSRQHAPKGFVPLGAFVFGVMPRRQASRSRLRSRHLRIRGNDASPPRHTEMPRSTATGRRPC